MTSLSKIFYRVFVRLLVLSKHKTNWAGKLVMGRMRCHCVALRLASAVCEIVTWACAKFLVWETSTIFESAGTLLSHFIDLPSL